MTVTVERQQLLTKNDFLTRERDQLNRERDQLNTSYINLTRERLLADALGRRGREGEGLGRDWGGRDWGGTGEGDRKSTRLNSSH